MRVVKTYLSDSVLKTEWDIQEIFNHFHARVLRPTITDWILNVHEYTVEEERGSQGVDPRILDDLFKMSKRVHVGSSS